MLIDRWCTTMKHGHGHRTQGTKMITKTQGHDKPKKIKIQRQGDMATET